MIFVIFLISRIEGTEESLACRHWLSRQGRHWITVLPDLFCDVVQGRFCYLDRGGVVGRGQLLPGKRVGQAEFVAVGGEVVAGTGDKRFSGEFTGTGGTGGFGFVDDAEWTEFARPMLPAGNTVMVNDRTGICYPVKTRSPSGFFRWQKIRFDFLTRISCKLHITSTIYWS